METYKLNDRVKITGKNVKGKVAFIGKTHFADGILYGISMDEAKGRHNGTVNNVRYFKCPKNHGTFVRACQLERDCDNISNRDKASKVIPPKPKYPNYLNPRTKFSLEQSRDQIKGKECTARAQSGTKQSDVTHRDDFEQKSKREPKEKCLEFSEAKDKSKYKLDDKESARRTSEKLNKIMAEMSVLKNELDCRYKQIAALQSSLSRLKSCLRWNRKFSCSNSLKDINLKRFIGQEIDVTIKNMEETVSTVDIKHFPDYSKGDTVLKEENNFLFQHVLDLEKQTEMLMETMLRIRSIILNQRKKRRLDQKCNYKQKPVAKLDQIKGNSYEYSSRRFSDGDASDCDRLSVGSLPRPTKPNAFDKNPKKGGENNSENFESDPEIFSELENECNQNGKSEEVKQDKNLSCFVSIPEPKNMERVLRFPDHRESLKSETKSIRTNFSKKTSLRYEPYPLSPNHKRGKTATDTNGKPFGKITKEFEDFINDIMAVASQSDEFKANSTKDSTIGPFTVREEENAVEPDPNPVESDSDNTEILSLKSRKARSHKVLPAAKGRISVIRRNPLKKKTVYSNRVLKRKAKCPSEGKAKEQE